MFRPHSDEEEKFIKYLVEKHVREPFWKRRIVRYILIIGVVAIFTTVILVAYPTDDNRYIPSSILDEFGWSEVRAIETSKEIIKAQLKSPLSAQFSNVRATLETENINYNEYKVTGNVKSVNTYGLEIKKSFYVTLVCHANAQYEIVDWDVF